MGIEKMKLPVGINKEEYERLIGEGFTHLEAIQSIGEAITTALVEYLDCGTRHRELSFDAGVLVINKITASQNGDYCEGLLEDEDDKDEGWYEEYLDRLKAELEKRK